uniref:Uncharacterized protein n=1 Tax=Parascaris univalens TaxID=6257 RepID=A0A915BGX1_PARUN
MSGSVSPSVGLTLSGFLGGLLGLPSGSLNLMSGFGFLPGAETSSGSSSLSGSSADFFGGASFFGCALLFGRGRSASTSGSTFPSVGLTFRGFLGLVGGFGLSSGSLNLISGFGFLGGSETSSGSSSLSGSSSGMFDGAFFFGADFALGAGRSASTSGSTSPSVGLTLRGFLGLVGGFGLSSGSLNLISGFGFLGGSETSSGSSSLSGSSSGMFDGAFFFGADFLGAGRSASTSGSTFPSVGLTFRGFLGLVGGFGLSSGSLNLISGFGFFGGSETSSGSSSLSGSSSGMFDGAFFFGADFLGAGRSASTSGSTFPSVGLTFRGFLGLVGGFGLSSGSLNLISGFVFFGGSETSSGSSSLSGSPSGSFCFFGENFLRSGLFLGMFKSLSASGSVTPSAGFILRGFFGGLFGLPS